MLNDVSQIDMSVKLFGRSYKTPFFLAPIGVQVLANEEAERAIAKAATVMEVPVIVSTVSTCSVEGISEAAPTGSKWFQLYFFSVNPDLSFSMVERAEKAGYEAIVITVDAVMAGWREQDIRSGFSPLSSGYGKGNYFNGSSQLRYDLIFLDQYKLRLSLDHREWFFKLVKFRNKEGKSLCSRATRLIDKDKTAI